MSGLELMRVERQQLNYRAFWLVDHRQLFPDKTAGSGRHELVTAVSLRGADVLRSYVLVIKVAADTSQCSLNFQI